LDGARPVSEHTFHALHGAARGKQMSKSDEARAVAAEAAIRAAVRAGECDDAAELACAIKDAALPVIERLMQRLTVRDDDFATELYFARLDIATMTRDAIRTTFPDKALELAVRVGRAASWLEALDVPAIVAECAAQWAEEVAA